MRAFAICFVMLATLLVGQWAVDYSFHGVALITNDRSWDTENFRRDRALNAFVTRYEFIEGSSYSTTLRITFDNASEYDIIASPLWLDCEGGLSPATAVEHKEGIIFPADTYSHVDIPARSRMTGYPIRSLGEGQVSCTMDLLGAEFR